MHSNSVAQSINKCGQQFLSIWHAGHCISLQSNTQPAACCRTETHFATGHFSSPTAGWAELMKDKRSLLNSMECIYWEIFNISSPITIIALPSHISSFSSGWKKLAFLSNFVISENSCAFNEKRLAHSFWSHGNVGSVKLPSPYNK